LQHENLTVKFDGILSEALLCIDFHPLFVMINGYLIKIQNLYINKRRTYMQRIISYSDYELSLSEWTAHYL
jgi:hypothetical protein